MDCYQSKPYEPNIMNLIHRFNKIRILVPGAWHGPYTNRLLLPTWEGHDFRMTLL